MFATRRHGKIGPGSSPMLAELQSWALSLPVLNVIGMNPLIMDDLRGCVEWLVLV